MEKTNRNHPHSLRESNKRHSSTSSLYSKSPTSLTSLCTNISPSSSHFFEVLYIGKVRTSHRKVPETFIDAALDKFRRNDLERQSKNLENQPVYNGLRRPSQDTEIRLPEAENNDETSADNKLKLTNNFKRNASSENVCSKIPENIPVPNEIKRPRARSVASIHGANSIIEHNRTMVFQVGRTDLRLISPDRKQILLHKQLKDVITTLQGIENPDHFGILCRDPEVRDSYLGYVFKCESASVAAEVIAAISRSYSNDNGKKPDTRVVVSCEHCPVVWFHRLCSDLEGIEDDINVQVAVFRKMEELPEDEQETIMAKLHASETLEDGGPDQQNRFLLTLLKAHCEGKQSRHVHDTAENRHEFLNQYLGGGTIFMKAKRSLTSSFDQLLKRRSSKDDISSSNKDLSSVSSSSRENISKLDVPSSPTTDKPRVPVTALIPYKKPEKMLLDSPATESGESPEKRGSSPRSMMDIFLKVGSSPKVSASLPSESEKNSPVKERHYPGSWRQAIFKNVNTPTKNVPVMLPVIERKEKLDYRALWQKAINQQILLIRMEKENAKLKARQEEATMKRIKLEYDDITSSGKENSEVWELIIKEKERKKYNDQMLLQAIRQGVPRGKRGEVWYFMAEQYCAKQPPPIDLSKFPNYNIPYEQLLKQLTSQQHAILIDLGRTFPNHSYFMSPLGPGQLALYNLLKAYSLLDPEVGYCQGLSFIAGILLLHMSEDQAFIMLRHLMFRRNLRSQYLPDMAALQVQLYQLTRLLRDTLPDLYNHFDIYEISPTLYAAPWMLTIFASQFPLGFVVRVFDLIFAEGSVVIFKVIISLLSYHKDKLLSCDCFESIMDYLKSLITVIDKKILDTVIKEVCTTDISKQLLEYSVEYSVLQEELSTPRPEVSKLKQAEETIEILKRQNQSLTEQLEIALSNNSRLETTRVKHMSQINKLECEVRTLEVTVSTLGNFVSTLGYSRNDIEIPPEILRIVSQLNVMERRRSRTGSSSTLDTSEASKNGIQQLTLGQLKSKNGVPYFANSFDQIKQKKINPFSTDSFDPGAETPLKKALSDTKGIKFEKIVEECDRSQSVERILTDEERETIKKFQNSYSKTQKEDIRKLLKPSKSSFELGAGKNQKGQSLHPLNCRDVQVSYSGMTKLRSIKPFRTKSEVQINAPEDVFDQTPATPGEASCSKKFLADDAIDASNKENCQYKMSSENRCTESKMETVKVQKSSNSNMSLSF